VAVALITAAEGWKRSRCCATGWANTREAVKPRARRAGGCVSRPRLREPLDRAHGDITTDFAAVVIDRRGALVVEQLDVGEARKVDPPANTVRFQTHD
jgi:hypothetical protein